MMAEAPRGKAVERSRLHHTRGPTDPLLRSTTPEPDKSHFCFLVCDYQFA